MRICIYGQDGVVGSRVAQRVSQHAGYRMAALDEYADVAVLCLPADAAAEQAERIGRESPDTVIIDGSHAHRQVDGWTYGFPELKPGHAAEIAASKRIANPGCYAVGSVALLHPVVAKDLLQFWSDELLCVHGVSGYTGGGRRMVEKFEADKDPRSYLYALDFEHAHSYEIKRHSGLAQRPMFVPMVGNFEQGMIVNIPLPIAADEVRGCLAEWYKDAAGIEVRQDAEFSLHPKTGDAMELHVLPHEYDVCLLVACYDNLGKGAAGNIMQVLELVREGRS